MHSPPKDSTIVAYPSCDKDNITPELGVWYAEITPDKGSGDLKKPQQIPFEKFMGFYTPEEFAERSRCEKCSE